MSVMAGGPECSQEALTEALRALDGEPMRIGAAEWPARHAGIGQAGLYSWWVDTLGAESLTDGLGLALAQGRIYAGQTGATKWPSGKTSKMSLAQRVGSLHLAGRIRGSTFRLTLAAILERPLGLEALGGTRLSPASERTLSNWMAEHLAVALFPVTDRDSLHDLETKVLAALDPPLNLDTMPSTTVRTQLSTLRSQLTRSHPE